MFIHYTDIDDDVRLLLPTTKVEFDCILEDSGPVAKHLKKIIPKRKRVGSWTIPYDRVDDH